MVGSLALEQELAGAIVGLMFSGGAALEDIASTRARRELTALVQRAPKVARRRVADRLEQVPVEQIGVGDIVVVRTGEVVPVDGTLVRGEAVLDTSTLSGEPLPDDVSRRDGRCSAAPSNAGAPFEVRADRPAAESAYAALVRLVQQAQAHRAPFVRMADRYAGFFLPATLLIAGSAWALSGDRGARARRRRGRDPLPADPRGADRARLRALASGPRRRDRQGRRGDRGARPRRAPCCSTRPARSPSALPEVREIVSLDGAGDAELLRLAASVDQMSAHVARRRRSCVPPARRGSR